MSESRREDLTTDILRDIRRAKAGTRILQGMRRQYLRRVAAAALLSVVMSGGGAQAQKSGGILRVYHRDSPASMSIHEEGTNSVAIPMMAVFNNLVLYDQHQAQPAEPPRSCASTRANPGGTTSLRSAPTALPRRPSC